MSSHATSDALTFAGKLDKFRYSTPDPVVANSDSPLRRSSRRAPPAKRFAVQASSGEDNEDESAYESEGLPLAVKRQRKEGKNVKSKKDKSADYSDLKPLTDILKNDLSIIFCGINPGCESARQGHHYAHFSNHFWKLIAAGGFTPRLYAAAEGVSLLELNIGMTNLVARPTKTASQLSEQESVGSVPVFLRKLVEYRPRVVSMNGMGIGETLLKYFRSRYPALVPDEEYKKDVKDVKVETKLKKLIAKPDYVISIKVKIGFLPFRISLPKRAGDNSEGRDYVLLHCVPSSSGLVVGYQYVAKVPMYQALKRDVDIITGKAEGVFALPEGSIDLRIEDLLDDWTDVKVKKEKKEEV